MHARGWAGLHAGRALAVILLLLGCARVVPACRTKRANSAIRVCFVHLGGTRSIQIEQCCYKLGTQRTRCPWVSTLDHGNTVCREVSGDHAHCLYVITAVGCSSGQRIQLSSRLLYCTHLSKAVGWPAGVCVRAPKASWRCPIVKLRGWLPGLGAYVRRYACMCFTVCTWSTCEGHWTSLYPDQTGFPAFVGHQMISVRYLGFPFWFRWAGLRVRSSLRSQHSVICFPLIRLTPTIASELFHPLTIYLKIHLIFAYHCLQ
jgi:hypothetical protein